MPKVRNGSPAGMPAAPAEEPAARWPQLETGPVFVVGIDPGDEHCGVAVVSVTWSPTEGGVILPRRAVELAPDDCADHLASWLLEGWVDAVAVERFSLYGDRASAQIGSQMETAQLIGVLRYVTRLANRGRRDAGQPEVPFALQGADVKKGIRAQAKARGIELIPASADHPRDAQLHAVYYGGREVLRWGV